MERPDSALSQAAGERRGRRLHYDPRRKRSADTGSSFRTGELRLRSAPPRPGPGAMPRTTPTLFIQIAKVVVRVAGLWFSGRFARYGSVASVIIPLMPRNALT